MISLNAALFTMTNVYFSHYIRVNKVH